MNIENERVIVKDLDFTPQVCLGCKYFKYCLMAIPNAVELYCKKGNKYFLANKPFVCGQYKLKRRK
jgi:hypothetical protein